MLQTVDLSTTVVVNEIPNMYAAMGDMSASDGSDYSDETGQRIAVAASEGEKGVTKAPEKNADNEKTFTNGTYKASSVAGVIQFEINDAMKDKAVWLNLYVDEFNLNSDERSSCYIAAYTVDNMTDTDNKTLSNKDASLTARSEPMFSEEMIKNGAYVRIDVSEVVQKAFNDGLKEITFKILTPAGEVYLADRNACICGGTYENKAAYLSVEDGYKVTVTSADKITKNGSCVTAETIIVPDKSSVKLYKSDETVVAFTDGEKVYGVSDGVTVIYPEKNITLYAATIGINMVQGAQVRIGGGITENGVIAKDSGLRFITTIDFSDTLACIDGAEFGVEITAEGDESNKVVNIPAEKWQDVEQTVFTSALTNLSESNYNRLFKATPYIIVYNQTFYGIPVERSIYQVEAGLLTKGYEGEDYGQGKDTTDTNYDEMSEHLINVLNAYVNQTGVRLTLSDNTETAKLTVRDGEESGAYTGEAFFTVSDTTYENGKYTVVLTAVGKSRIDVNLFNKYVRINNNNSCVSPFTTICDNGDNTYALVFDYSSMNDKSTLR